MRLLLASCLRCILSYQERKFHRACVQSVLTYGTETWAMKAENLHSLERVEHNYDGEMDVWSVFNG